MIQRRTEEAVLLKKKKKKLNRKDKADNGRAHCVLSGCWGGGSQEMGMLVGGAGPQTKKQQE